MLHQRLGTKTILPKNCIQACASAASGREKSSRDDLQRLFLDLYNDYVHVAPDTIISVAA
jgi:hypothetical protein